MNFHLAGWAALSGFALIVAWCQFGWYAGELYDQGQITKGKLRQTILVSIIALPVWVSCIWQGLYLLSVGYSVDILAQSSSMNPTKGRLIVVLAIQYLPYFLILGYGYFAVISARLISRYLHKALE